MVEYYRKLDVLKKIMSPKSGYNLKNYLNLKNFNKKIVFYPFAGYEFGTALKYMLKVHYHVSNHKIVCIPRGYECFFPDAKEFIYDYPGPYWDNFDARQWPMWKLFESDPRDLRERRFFRWNSPVHASIKEEFDTFIKSKHPDADIMRIPLTDLLDPIDGKRIKTFAKIPFSKTNHYKINVDVVFSNRRITSKVQLGISDERTFKKWHRVVKVLKEKGFNVGGIGRKGEAFEDLNIVNNFDYDNPNQAAIEMLHNAKYYIGTDTGTTHLAMNFPHLKSLLFRCDDGSEESIFWYESENVKIIHEMSNGIENFNKQKLLFKHMDEFFV